MRCVAAAQALLEEELFVAMEQLAARFRFMRRRTTHESHTPRAGAPRVDRRVRRQTRKDIP